MSDPALGLSMLGLIVVVIMLGFPTAFTLMGLGMFFGFIAFHDPAAHWLDNRIFDLMVQRAFGAMTNETLLSIPLFVLMGYVMERGALVDKMFHSVQLAFRRVPGSLAVTTLIVCTFWGIASGLVGAVVVLMGVIAMRPMLNAGYDTRLAAGVITAGGTLGILIPPSVMIIVYAAVAGQSVVKLYAAAMFPGFFLAFLYLIYVIGWAMLQPKVAPKLPPDQQRAPISPWVAHIAASYSPRMLPALAAAVVSPARALRGAAEGVRITWWMLLRSLLSALVPLALAAATLGSVWWYVAIYSQADNNSGNAPVAQQQQQQAAPEASSGTGLAEPPASDAPKEPAAEGGLQEPPGGVEEPPGSEAPAPAAAEGGLRQLGEAVDAPKTAAVPEAFYTGFLLASLFTLALLAWYYWRMDAEQFEILRMLVSSVMPLATLTLVVLGVILFGITTATESAAVGAAGAFLMAWQAGTLNFKKIKEAVFLTLKTTSMVCWLFVGSALFSAVFALLGGQRIVEEWVLGMNLSPLQFLLLSQAIIFILGWPLEWTEIIVIFVPIFLPLLAHFQIDPLLFGVLVFVNLQAAFLSPPVAMSAFYLKGVSPPHVTINQIFAGMMPYMLIVILCMVFMYIWPGLTLWLPQYLYG
ncbi:tripartite ATP-independent transporter DctM subunit [Variovorax beijingensis]|uniref:TRAP-type mannitol/chloroaromatic compound transport system permease large subunit n=2 Tax=Variovorax TaxID=34072 RepID=A0AAE3XY01_VARPD|nr:MULTISPECIES: TRAP transporter large permease subunit [Variovorax]MDP9968315.1 TRAP-type mannitol/chloroaromatic compound transport system permease large subunit [Variovorax paradoxus]MDR6425932.1 TRAP-type mannitol/chloroaromatic compound transport system permease large subunit [Variovorax paradoxus]MDR6456816.1 TRAP-type mannitol/chloroaromatic compound transport system permease large subunit [Variovorax paradoxus]TWD90936.1 tripartite ATP-independent transporter DctM subunit [Variovorax b